MNSFLNLRKLKLELLRQKNLNSWIKEDWHMLLPGSVWHCIYIMAKCVNSISLACSGGHQAKEEAVAPAATGINLLTLQPLSLVCLGLLSAKRCCRFITPMASYSFPFICFCFVLFFLPNSIGGIQQ